jgi:hypothetical protein
VLSTARSRLTGQCVSRKVLAKQKTDGGASMLRLWPRSRCAVKRSNEPNAERSHTLFAGGYGLFARWVWSICSLCVVCLFVGARRRVCLLDAVGAVYREGLSSGVYSVSKGIVMEAFECGSW